MVYLLSKFRHFLFMGAFLFSVCFVGHATFDNSSDESLIINYIIEEGGKDEDKRDLKRIKEITDFAYGKVIDIAKKNKKFAEDIIFDEKGYEEGYYVTIDKINDEIFLIAVPTAIHNHHQRSGCLFLINIKNPDWTPLQIDQFVYDKIEKNYRVIIHDVEGLYDDPLLSTTAKIGGMEIAFRKEFYLFKEGEFRLILSFETGDKYKIDYIDPVLYKLSKKFGFSKEYESINAMTTIYFVKSQKAYFHIQPDEKTKQDFYISRGDAVYVSSIKEDWGFAQYIVPGSNKEISGWIKLKDTTEVFYPFPSKLTMKNYVGDNIGLILIQ